MTSNHGAKDENPWWSPSHRRSTSLITTMTVLAIAWMQAAGNVCSSNVEEAPWCDGCTVDEMWDLLKCDAVYREKRPVPSVDDWMLMRRAYENVVGTKYSSISPLSSKDGFVVSHRAEHVEKKGRGIFAATSIKRGELVWTGKQTAKFEDATSFRKFIKAIPVSFACDVMQWSYTEYYDNTKQQLLICTDLDDASLCNNSRERVTTNVGCNPNVEWKFPAVCEGVYALRDIDVGEELLCWYGEFEQGEVGWKRFGL